MAVTGRDGAMTITELAKPVIAGTKRCAYCGVRNGKLTKDHVVPKCLYSGKPGSTVQRITVPCCLPCQKSWTDDEAHFRNVLPLARRSDPLPFGDAFAHPRVDRFDERPARLVYGHREEAHGVAGQDRVRAGRGDVFPLPADAPHPQAHDLVGTQTGVHPHDGHRADQLQWVAERATRSAADAGRSVSVRFMAAWTSRAHTSGSISRGLVATGIALVFWTADEPTTRGS
jgi:hypothetical protein